MQQTTPEKNSPPAFHKNSSPESKLLELSRKFDVPVQKLFNAFTTSEVLKTWWWPEGIHSDQIDLEFREGGRYFINMKGFEDGSGGMTGHFEKIVPNQLIVMSDQFADESGRAISAEEAKMPGQWPERVYITFDFESVNENQSKLTLSQQGIPNEMQKDCKQGWSQMFDKLDRYLSGLKN